MQKQINKGEIMCRNKSVWWIVVKGRTDWCKPRKDESRFRKTCNTKCQLQFKQKVISMCPSNDRKLFFLSEKGHANSVQELTDNLKNLLRQLKNDKTTTRSSLIYQSFYL